MLFPEISFYSIFFIYSKFSNTSWYSNDGQIPSSPYEKERSNKKTFEINTVVLRLNFVDFKLLLKKLYNSRRYFMFKAN